MMGWLVPVALGLMVWGWLLLRRANTLRQESGLPAGRLIYSDTASDWLPNNTPFYSATHHLTGKPDYLVQTPSGAIIPVEIKSSSAPSVPYLGHLLQLAAYCLLVEETTGQRPPHGLLKYADALYEVDFSWELREELLATLAAMRAAHLAETVARSHEQPARCHACGFYERCEEALP